MLGTTILFLENTDTSGVGVYSEGEVQYGGGKLPKMFSKNGLVLFCLTLRGGIMFLLAVRNRSLCLLKSSTQLQACVRGSLGL